MTVERVNPELLLRAAQLAQPDKEWIISVLGNVVETGKLNYFDIMIYGSDAWALERALKDERNGGWVFYKTPKGIYVAFNIDSQPQSDPSDTLLLLKAVSAQFSIPLYLEGGE